MPETDSAAEKPMPSNSPLAAVIATDVEPDVEQSGSPGGILCIPPCLALVDALRISVS
jgi:hypothetical protein